MFLKFRDNLWPQVHNQHVAFPCRSLQAGFRCVRRHREQARYRAAIPPSLIIHNPFLKPTFWNHDPSLATVWDFIVRNPGACEITKLQQKKSPCDAVHARHIFDNFTLFVRSVSDDETNDV